MILCKAISLTENSEASSIETRVCVTKKDFLSGWVSRVFQCLSARNPSRLAESWHGLDVAGALFRAWLSGLRRTQSDSDKRSGALLLRSMV